MEDTTATDVMERRAAGSRKAPVVC